MSEPGDRAPARARPLPALTFLLVLLALAAIGAGALLTPPRIITGLPDDPEVARVRGLVHDRLRAECGDARFVPTLLGDLGEPDAPLAIRAERELLAARERLPRDPRLLAALGSLGLAAQRHAQAERYYRRALDMAPTYGEARMGLGVTLAMRAAAEGREDRARGLRLSAIAQFAAVPEEDPMLLPALYNRVRLLVRVGRLSEARRRAQDYFARDPGSPWALVLQRELDALPR